jgi:hypothetical protein
MKQLLLLFACFITLGATAQSDTIYYTVGFKTPCTINEIKDGKITIITNGNLETTVLSGVKSIYVSDNNKNKSQILSAYNYYLNPVEVVVGSLPVKTDGKYKYTEVVKLDSTLSKNELYNRAKFLITDMYKSAKDVIQLDDKENGIILVKGLFEQYWQSSALGGNNVRVYHKLTLYLKDGRYKYEISDFVVDYSVSGTKYTSTYTVNESLETWNTKRPDNLNKFLVNFDINVKDIISTIKKGMEREYRSTNDW